MAMAGKGLLFQTVSMYRFCRLREFSAPNHFDHRKAVTVPDTSNQNNEDFDFDFDEDFEVEVSSEYNVLNAMHFDHAAGTANCDFELDEEDLDKLA